MEVLQELYRNHIARNYKELQAVPRELPCARVVDLHVLCRGRAVTLRIRLVTQSLAFGFNIYLYSSNLNPNAWPTISVFLHFFFIFRLVTQKIIDDEKDIPQVYKKESCLW